MKKIKKELIFHLMLIPGVLITLIFSYLPMFGISMAFLKYKPALGFYQSEWIGLANFLDLFANVNFYRALRNTVIIAWIKIVAGLAAPVVLALMLNEIRHSWFKRISQTIVYFPHFISWILMSGMIVDIFAPNGGTVNIVLNAAGCESIFFLGDNDWARFTIIITDLWKNTGWGTIVFLAALTGIDMNLYEAAALDGAGRLKQVWYITLPGIMPTVVLVGTLSLGNVLNAGFDQIYNLMNGVTMETLDIIDTLVYRLGFENGGYSISTAAGLFKSVISSTFLVISYKLADKYAGYRIF